MKKVLIFLSTLFFLSYTVMAQCAMCKAAAESDLQNNPNSVAKGINSGILFLMIIPYVLMAFFFRKEIIHFFKRKSNKVHDS